MSDLSSVLQEWYAKLQALPGDAHLLCPKTSDDDDENYRVTVDPNSQISPEEKQKRIALGEEKIEITFWNSLIFGFDRKDAGKWLDEFTSRLENCLTTCDVCVLNWHLKRKAHLRRFAERWDEEAITSFSSLLEGLDMKRISQGLDWAAGEIRRVEDTGQVFKKSAFADRIGQVHITIYEALCFLPFLKEPERLQQFTLVFSKLQGKKGLRLGSGDPLPGITLFLLDHANDDRRRWAQMNWEPVMKAGSMTDEQFDWAVRWPLINGISSVNRRDFSQRDTDTVMHIERFWGAVDEILKAMSADLISSRLRDLPIQPGDRPLYDLLFSHMVHSPSEAVLVATIKVLTTLLERAPDAVWNFIGEAKPSVIPDQVLTNPVFGLLLSQALDDCYTGIELTPGGVPFPLSWTTPWLRSVSVNQRYDACSSFVHTLSEKFGDRSDVGEAGQAACNRAILDALRFTVNSVLQEETCTATKTLHYLANETFNLLQQHQAFVIRQCLPASGSSSGWLKFEVGSAAKRLLEAGMSLDLKLLKEEYLAQLSEKASDDVKHRQSKAFWSGIQEAFDRSSDQVDFAARLFTSLTPIIDIEQLRPQKRETLTKDAEEFNKSLAATTDALAMILSSVAELDPHSDLNALFDNASVARVIVGLSLQGDSDLAEASCQILKNWTGEVSRSAAFEVMSRDNPMKAMGTFIWSLDSLMAKPYVPWNPVRPMLQLSLDILHGLTDASTGVLRKDFSTDGKFTATLLRWWQSEWAFVSRACKKIEFWTHYISNVTMSEFCREIMELAEALIAEDGLITSALALSMQKDESTIMKQILEPAKKNFRGLDNMIRLKDAYLVDVTVRVLCKILGRLRDNDLEIASGERKFIIEACVRDKDGKYTRATNLQNGQRAELLQAMGYDEDEIQITKIVPVSTSSGRETAKKQSRLDDWSKSGSSTTSSLQTSRTNRDDVNDLSKSLQNPILKQLQAAKAKPQPLKVDPKARLSIKESRAREKAEKKARDAAVIAEAKRLRGETVPGEGSGLQGLGVMGKDHGKSEIMVNSSDEESEDDADSDTGDQLATITGTGKTTDDIEKRRRLALLQKAREPVKKVRRQRNAKEMRARLVPPMDKLHNIVLGWDLFHPGNEPPSGPASHEVAPKYSDPQTYQRTFLPLLASEAWRSFVTSKDETTSQAFGMKIASRASVDSYLEVTFTMPITDHRNLGVREGDILLISEAQSPLNSPGSKSCLARIQRTKYKKDAVEITYRVTPRNNPIANVLNPNTTVHGLKITNMATIEREYAALESLQYYDLCDEILRAEPSPILKYSPEKVTNSEKTWGLNRAQAMAVLGAYDNDGFTLIQGPPGTGKTKTIVAMVGNLLSEQLNQMPGPTRPAGIPVRPLGQAQAPAQNRSKKLLVCAPSNAAVDELVLRLKAGVVTRQGQSKKINVLRLGRTDAINAAVKDVSLDELVRVRLEGDTTKEDAKASRDKLHEEAGKLKDQLNELRPKRDQAKDAVDQTEYSRLSREFDELKKRQFEIGKKIDANKDSANSVGREMELRKKQIQQEILNSAQVLCATLSGSGHDMFRNLDVEFDTVIIDEAAQCVELSALIPLKYGCCKCILVGDPKQLPPTVLSQSAARFGYDQSLFVRMQQNYPKMVHLLDTQYRMHPEISAFPSKEFYESQLQDGPSMAPLRQQPWHRSTLLGPYRFFDVQGVQERGRKGQSLINTKELDAALQIYERFSKDFSGANQQGKIGIITPYKAQLFELRRRFEARYGEGITSIIEFNTTDAFQGRECEIIIFSCVRASATGGIGFMTDIRRMNVGLTRAKSSLWILGDSRALVQGEFWKKLIEDAKTRDRYTSGDIVGMFQKRLQLTEGPAIPETNNLVQNDTVMSEDPPHKPPGTTGPNDPNATSTSENTNGGKEPQSVPSRVAGSGAPPTIQTGGKPSDVEGKKRSLDDDKAAQPAIKRINNQNKPRGVSLMSKFGGSRPAPRPPKAPTDPSAMAALGLVPPERPPPTTSTAMPKPPNNTRTGAETNGEGMRPPRRPQGPPLPRKKDKPSMFIRRK